MKPYNLTPDFLRIGRTLLIRTPERIFEDDAVRGIKESTIRNVCGVLVEQLREIEKLEYSLSYCRTKESVLYQFEEVIRHPNNSFTLTEQEQDALYEHFNQLFETLEKEWEALPSFSQRNDLAIPLYVTAEIHTAHTRNKPPEYQLKVLSKTYTCLNRARRTYEAYVRNHNRYPNSVGMAEPIAVLTSTIEFVCVTGNPAAVFNSNKH